MDSDRRGESRPEVTPVATGDGRAGDPAPQVPFIGWRVVAGTFVILMVTAGIGFYGLGVFLEAITDERGWTTGAVSGATAAFFLVSGFSSVLVGRLIARFDVRLVVAGGLVVCAVAVLGLGRADRLWLVYAAYVVFALGFAASGLVPSTTLVTRWFHRRRSLALAVASTGLSVGGLVVTPAVAWLIDRRELAGATPFFAVAFLAMLPVALFVLSPDPTARGQAPDGDVAPAGGPPAATGLPYEVAVRTRFFTMVTGAYVLAMAAQVGGLQHLFKLTTERLDRGTAALAVLLVAGTSVLMRLVGGAVLPRLSMTGFTAACMAVQGASLLWLSGAQARLALLGGAVVLGTTVGNILMLQPLLVAERFGVRDYPRIFARAQFVTTIGVAGGPLVLGAIHDNQGYTGAYLLAGALSLLAVVAVVLAGPARWSPPARSDAPAAATAAPSGG